MDEKLAGYLNVGTKKGVIVTMVEAQSPAEKAGVEESDIILSIEKKRIGSVDEYEAVTKMLAAGDTLHAELWRGGDKKSVTIKTRLFPLELAEDLAIRLLGIGVDELTQDNRRVYDVSARQGVVIVKVKKQSYLAHIGAEPGDVIRQIDDYSIQDMEDFKKAVIKFRHKNSVVLLLQRGGQGYYITVNLE